MPRFPFKRSVAQDLRDLWAIDRIDRQSRNLGLSSLSPGDGSLDLISGGTTVARYGDGPSGQFGILVPDDSGGWRTVQQDAQARATAAETSAKSHADSAVSGVQSEVTTARGGFANLNARLSDHASRLGGTEGRLTTAEGRLDSHASRIGATENVANGVQSEVSTARGGFGSLSARLSDHASRIGGAETDIGTLENDVGRMKAHLSNLSTWLSDVWDTLQSHESRLTALDGGSSPNPGPPPSTMI